jgi:glucose/arabinose dehydrogenase
LIARRLITLGLTATIVASASACGSSPVGRRAAGSATNTSAPTAPATGPAAEDPGPGPTTITGVNVRLEPVVTLDTPVALVPRSGTDDLYVAEQGGKVRIVRVKRTIDAKTNAVTHTTYSVDPASVLDLSDTTDPDGERGLLGLVFSSDGRRLYVDYTDHDGNSHVVEYPMTGDKADARNPRELLFVRQPFPNHNGGSLAIGPDGFLYIGFGDGGSSGDPNGNGQNTNTLLGKILRIDPEARTGDLPYAIPDGNPFVHGGGAPEVWLYGVRNPWRFSFDGPDLWIGDVGQNLIEEIDLLRPTADGGEAGKGANLGWNRMEGSQPFEGGTPPAGAIAPILDYPHSGGNCSVIGGFVYRGRAVPALQGVYVFGDYCLGELRGLLQRNGTKLDERSLGVTVGQGLTSFGQDNDGELYVLNSSGPVVKIEST